MIRLLVILILFTLPARASSQTPSALRLGVLAHRSTAGSDLVSGALQAIDEINSRPGPFRYALQLETIERLDASTAAALERFAAMGAGVIITDGDELTMAAHYQGGSAVVLAANSFSPLAKARVYRLNGERRDEAQRLVEALGGEGSTVGVLYEASPLCNRVRQEVEEELGRRGRPILGSEEIDEHIGLASAPLSALVIVASAEGTKTALMAARGARYPAVVSSFGCAGLLDMRAELKGTVRAWCARPRLGHPSYETFLRLHGKVPSYEVALGYDGAMLASAALLSCGGRADAACLDAALGRPQSYPGLSGEISFDPATRAPAERLVLLKFRDGELVEETPQP